MYPALLLFLLAEAACPLSARALQAHAAPEGLYVHQIGHILFTLAMIGFALRIRSSRLYRQKSWRLMALGSVLFALWNIWAFCGHVVALMVPPGDFSLDSHVLDSYLLLRAPVDVLYYILKLDHLLCIPALFCFYLALRKMTTRPPAAGGGKEEQ
jgi:hypothetical protein